LALVLFSHILGFCVFPHILFFFFNILRKKYVAQNYLQAVIRVYTMSALAASGGFSQLLGIIFCKY